MNIASQLISNLIEKVVERPGIATFHVLGGGRGVSVRRALQTMLAHYGIPVNPFPLPKSVLQPFLLRLIKVPLNSGEYLHTQWTFSSKNLERELPGFRYPSYAHYSEKMMNYADQHFFSKGKKV